MRLPAPAHYPSIHPIQSHPPPTEMTTLPHFRMKVARPTPEMPEMTTGPSAPPAVLCLDLRADDVRAARADDPATSRKPGSFNYDRESGKFPHQWASMADFDEWRRTEELASSIELIASTVVRGKGLWTKRCRYICSRQLSGGKNKYEKKCPERHANYDSKKTGCACKIVIKLYPHTPVVLGRYEKEHSHEVGTANLAYVRVSQAARLRIREMLESKVDPREIVRNMHHTFSG